MTRQSADWSADGPALACSTESSVDDWHKSQYAACTAHLPLCTIFFIVHNFTAIDFLSLSAVAFIAISFLIVIGQFISYYFSHYKLVIYIYIIVMNWREKIMFF